MTDFLKNQIITYMGNKRKLIYKIDELIDYVMGELGESEISSADAFSGSGIVSRLLKTRSSILFTNDLAGYSNTLNKCYLSTPDNDMLFKIRQYVEKANAFASGRGDGGAPAWIRKHWHQVERLGSEIGYILQNGMRC